MIAEHVDDTHSPTRFVTETVKGLAKMLMTGYSEVYTWIHSTALSTEESPKHTNFSASLRK